MNIGGPESRVATPAFDRNLTAPGSMQRPVSNWRLTSLAAVAVDVLSAIVAIMSAGKLIHFQPAADAWAFQINVVLAGLMLAATHGALGLYRMPGTLPCGRLRLRVLGALLFAGYSLLVTLQANGWGPALLFVVLCGGLVLMVGYIANQLLDVAFSRLGQHGIPTAIIGIGEEARAVAVGLLDNPDIGLRPIGFIALPDQPAVGVELPLPLLCRLEHAALIEPKLDVAVVAMNCKDRADIEARFGPMPFPHIALIRNKQALQALRLSPDAFLADTKALRFSGQRQGAASARLLKRAIDLVLTVPAVLVTLPIILLLIAAVRIADPGRAIFMQQRIGFRGRSFNVYKIRTMYHDAQERLEKALTKDPKLAAEWRSNFKLENDPRILPGIGHILRRFSLDELPQLWNVLLGDMSLAGPRPFPPYHLKSFDVEFQTQRSSVMPGLTGLWQITVRSDGDLAAQKEQDTLYIENWSIWLDLQIMLQTLPAVLRAKGAR